MTLREWAEDYCMQRGMFPDQAAEVVRLASENGANEPLKTRWNDQTEGYPTSILAILSMCLDREALNYIEKPVQRHGLNQCLAADAAFGAKNYRALLTSYGKAAIIQ